MPAPRPLTAPHGRRPFLARLAGLTAIVCTPIPAWPTSPPDPGPASLSRCPRCRELRGTATHLDRPVRVACLCAATCPRCRQKLSGHRPGSFFYDETTGRVLHVPVFAGMLHTCPTLTSPVRADPAA